MRRRKWVWWLVAVCLAGAAALMAAMSGAGPDLLRAARRVPARTVFGADPNVVSWANGREVVVIDGQQVERLDVRTGDVQPVASGGWWRVVGRWTGKPARLLLPPTSAQLLGAQALRKPGPPLALSPVRLGGLPQSLGGFAAPPWCPLDDEGRVWAGVLRRTSSVGTAILRYSAGPRPTIQCVAVLPEIAPGLSGFYALGLTPAGSAVYVRADQRVPPGTPFPPCRVALIDPRQPSAPPVTRDLPGTAGNRCLGLRLAPAGDRLLYTVLLESNAARSPVIGWLNHVLPTARPAVALWVADVDGSHARCLGAARDTTPQAASRSTRPAASPEWSPDGRRIAFAANGQVYVMDIPRR